MYRIGLCLVIMGNIMMFFAVIMSVDLGDLLLPYCIQSWVCTGALFGALLISLASESHHDEKIREIMSRHEYGDD